MKLVLQSTFVLLLCLLSPVKSSADSQEYLSKETLGRERDAMDLYLSYEGQRCIDFLKKGSTTRVAMVFTMDSWPVKKRKFYASFSKLIESSYFYLGLKALPTGKGGKRKAERAEKRLTAFRDEEIVKVNPLSQMSIEELAVATVRANEAGYFCPAEAFTPRGQFAPKTLGSLYVRSPYNYCFSPHEIVKFLQGNEVSEEDIMAFRQAANEHAAALETAKAARETAKAARVAKDSARLRSAK